MLRMTKLVSGMVQANVSGVLNAGLNPVCVQCVRWRRKPRWIPIAKSKIFRVPERTATPPDELIELQRLHNNYKTQMRSIRRHIRVLLEKDKLEVDEAHVEKIENEDFKRCSAINNAWNSQVAQSRETRLAEEREAQRQEILRAMLEKEGRDAEIMKRVEEHVKKVKEEAITFITADNIDRAIEEALANEIDHDFAIDSQGNVYEGKDTEMTPDKPDEEDRLQASN